jgi:hypothetical protein
MSETNKEREIFVVFHGKLWWRSRESTCPDCTSKAFIIVSQDYNIHLKNPILDSHNDITYTMHAECTGCGCEWYEAATEKNAIHKDCVLRGIKK